MGGWRSLERERKVTKERKDEIAKKHHLNCSIWRLKLQKDIINAKKENFKMGNDQTIICINPIQAFSVLFSDGYCPGQQVLSRLSRYELPGLILIVVLRLKNKWNKDNNLIQPWWLGGRAVV